MGPFNKPNKGRQGKRKAWSFSYWGGTPEEKEENYHERLPSSQGIIPLAQAPVGSDVSIVSFGGKDGVNTMLKMGLNLRTQLQIIRTNQSGSVVVKVGNSKMGLGAGIAAKIMVSVDPLLEGEEK